MIAEVYCVFEEEEHVGLHLKAILGTFEEAKELVKDLGRKEFEAFLAAPKWERSAKHQATKYVIEPFSVYESAAEWQLKEGK